MTRRGDASGAQLELAFDARPPVSRSRPTAAVAADVIVSTASAPLPADVTALDRGGQLLATLRALGLRGIERCRLTKNRRTMVSFRGAELRVHEGYCTAPDDVLRALVVFMQGRGVARRRAREAILAYPIARPQGPARREAPHPADAGLVQRLRDWHGRFNQERFGGALSAVPLRVSRRMRSRLGHYRAPSPADGPGEIVISRRHIRRDGWDDALHTLLHEMVHQWQHETGRPVDHGPAFRRKARELGISPAATRRVDGPLKSRGEDDIFPPCVA